MTMYALYVFYFVLFSVSSFIIYLVCGRLLARLLEFIAKNVFKVHVEIKRAHFFALSGIKISTAATKIEVENIVLQSKWGFQGATRLFMLCFGHITVTAAKGRCISEEKSQEDNGSTRSESRNNSSGGARIAAVVGFVSKYLGIYLRSLDVVIRDQPSPKFNIILQVLKGAKILFKSEKSLLKYSITTTKFVSQLHQVKEVDSDLLHDVTLAEVAFNILLEGSLDPFNSPNTLEWLSVKVNPLQLSIGDNFIKNIPVLHHTNSQQLSLTDGRNEDSERRTTPTFIRYLPKHFDVTFTDTDVYICDQEQRELSVHMDKLTLKAANGDNLPPLETMVQLTGLKIQARRSKDIVSLKNLVITAKTETRQASLTNISSTVYVESCRCNYIHEEFSHWAAFFVFKKTEIETENKNSLFGTVNKFFKQISFENDLEIIDFTASLTDNPTNGKPQQVCQAVVASLVTNVVLPAGDDLQQNAKIVNCSAMLENAYVYFNGMNAEPSNLGILLKDNPSVLPSSKKHIWGRVVELGSFGLKCDVELVDSDPSPQRITIKCDASSLVLEYSKHTKYCLTALLQTGQMYKIFKNKGSTNTSSDPVKTVVKCEIKVHHINVFCVGQSEGGVDSVVARLDEASVISKDGTSIIVHGCKVERLRDVKKEAFNCEESSKLSYYILGVPKIETYFNSKANKITLPQIVVQWDPASHMAVHDRISGIIEDGKELQDIVGDASNPPSSKGRPTSTSQFEIEAKDVDIKMKTSSECSFGVQFSGVIKMDQGWIMAESPNVSISFDEKQIFQFKTLSLKQLKNLADVTTEREKIEGFQSVENKIWVWNSEIHVLFPYRFNFGKSLDKFLIVNKFLRQLYRKPRSGTATIEPLYADVWVNLTKVSFEIEDDPFEVKLGKNYEVVCPPTLELQLVLLSDEALQWIERERLLEERINDVRKKPGNRLSDKKVDDLYYSLSETKSKIYIERSVKLYVEDKRTRLCCWEFTDVNLMILADQSMNGKDRIFPLMKRIDNESQFPSNIEFTTLWCRFIKGTISSSTFTLRDYQQPLFFCESFDISGSLIGAEQVPTERGRRTCAVEICQPWGDMTVSRGMTPLKYFHDLTFDFQKLEVTWGVDYEPAYAMVSVAFVRLKVYPAPHGAVTRQLFSESSTGRFDECVLYMSASPSALGSDRLSRSEHINKASVDPSISLPFWDKMRLLLHGRLLMNIKEWQLNWRATRNPYDKSENLEIECRNVRFDWTNARFDIFGDFNLFTRTASKYDDCCVLHLPALRFCADLQWHCRDNGDPNYHYNVRPCAPDKLPELSPGQSHDSYASFRSQNLSLDVSFEVEGDKLKDDDMPTILLYATTFRWFQNFQAVVWRNVSRPIKKGSIFNRILAKRKPLSRHYRNVGLKLKFPQLRVFYWGSFTKNLGAELNLGVGSLHTVYRVGIEEFNDSLIRRPAATWSIIKLDSEIDDVTCYVTGIEDKGTGSQTTEESLTNKEEESLEPSRFYLGHVDRLVYKRKEFDANMEQSETDGVSISSNLEDYTHNLVCHNFRGVWTLTNRKLSFGLVETYTRSQQLKRDLSADALKSVKVEKKNDSLLDTSTDSSPGTDTSSVVPTSQTMLDEFVSKTIGKSDGGNDSLTDGSTTFGLVKTRPRSTTGDILLDQLVSETSSKFFVKTEEGKTAETQSSGYILCNSDDLLEQRWHFEFINSQVMLKGIENAGCLFVTAGNAKVFNRLHQPTQTGRKLLNKKTWVGHLENMQYFCTVRANDDISKTDIPWLDSNVIHSRRKNTVLDLTDLSNVFGSGDSVGGMVGNMLASSSLQLQRIVSRCGCEFYYASFDDDLEPGMESVPAHTPSPSRSANIRGNQSSGEPVNTFTLKHPILEICINSAQYALILDIVSNVLLYTEPQKKEVSDLEQRMSFYFQLSNAEDLKGTILHVQNNVRAYLIVLNELRRALYNLNEVMKEKEKEKTEQQTEDLDKEIEELKEEKQQYENEVAETKANLSELSTELRILISAYKDLQTNRVLLSPEKARGEELMKVVEVFLDHVTWRLTQPDGQLQIVDANLKNLRYTNIAMNNSSGVHSVEVGDFNMTNLMPNSPYKKVLTPRGERRVGKDVAVRVYCQVKSPVGGIGVKDHFEVNLCPLNVGLTHRLYTLMMGYFFPGRAHEYVSESGDVDLGFGLIESPVHKDVFHEEATASQKPVRPNTLSVSDTSLNEASRNRQSTSSLDSPQKPGRSRFYASLSETASKELDKMKERASQTNNFVYVKIPEIPIYFSYKGEKEKNLVDVHNFRLNLPTLQYQNRTWTWLDLMMAVKKDYRQVLVGQIIKEKLHWKGGENKETKIPVEEDKAKILFGDKKSGPRKKKKKSLFTKFGLKHKGDKTETVVFDAAAVHVASYDTLGKDEEERLETQSRSGDDGEMSGLGK